jgi:hypothetical protein
MLAKTIYMFVKTRLQLESEFRKFINGGNLLQNNFHIEAPQVELTPLHAHYAFKTFGITDRRTNGRRIITAL